MFKITIDDPLPEQATAVIEAQVEDEFGIALPRLALTEAKLTLYNEHDGQIINAQDGVDILDDIDDTGKLTHTLLKDDMVILDPKRSYERHCALFRWKYGANKTGVALVIFVVENLLKIS